VAFVVLTVASGATALATGPMSFTIAQGFVRVATSAVGTLAVVLIAERVQPGLRAFVIGLYAAAGSLGAGMGQLMLPIAERSPQAWRFAFAAPLIGVLALPFMRRIEESPLIDLRPTPVPLVHVLKGARSSVFWIAGISALLAAAFPAVALAFTNERLVNDLGFSATRATVLALSAGTLGALGFWIGGRLADVWGRRPTTVLALACSVVGGVALFSVESTPALFASIAIGGFGTFAYVPAAASHRTELFPTEVRATAGSLNAYLATVGSASGLGAGAVLIDRFGLGDTLMMLAIASAIAACLTLLLPETRNQQLLAQPTDAVGRNNDL
jgi:predicted MFS family arabinose efflux permease